MTRWITWPKATAWHLYDPYKERTLCNKIINGLAQWVAVPREGQRRCKYCTHMQEAQRGDKTG
jgi:hypothetical protein